MKNIRVFLLAMYEFRRSVTTHFDEPEINTYDLGREWAHRLTLRLYEEEPEHYPWSRRLTFRQGIWDWSK